MLDSIQLLKKIVINRLKTQLLLTSLEVEVAGVHTGEDLEGKMKTMMSLTQFKMIGGGEMFHKTGVKTGGEEVMKEKAGVIIGVAEVEIIKQNNNM